MKKLLAAAAAIALTAILPAQATTFSLRTIYIASGVSDDGGAANVGTATTVFCTNASGKSTTLRIAFYDNAGTIRGLSAVIIPHLTTYTLSTHVVAFFSDQSASTGAILQGVLNVSTTESAVFCSAMIVDAAAATVQGVDLHMVRFNPHPGTVE